MQQSVTVGEHLLNRLVEAGASHLFGVPGDYNLAFLDQVIDHPAIRWVGNANELNAAYAADGYARLNGIAAMLTTFGVGELSAINGIAGSYAEYVPVLQIVGAPSVSAQRQRLLMHHSLCDGHFEHFMSAARAVTVAQASLTVENAAEEIDRVLKGVLRERRPGYIMLPADVARASLLTSPGKLQLDVPKLSKPNLDAFATDIKQLLGRSSSSVVLADFLVDRFRLRSEVQELIEAGSFSNATLSMGKGVLDEHGPGYLGIYSGAASTPEVRSVIESADAVIAVGVTFADVLTAGFSHQIDPRKLIDIQPFGATVAGRFYADVPMAHALAAITKHARGRKTERAATAKLTPVSHSGLDDEPLSQATFWSAVQSYLRSGDLIVADQGTSFYGSVTLRLPPAATYIGQPLWASIGYGLPAAFGAQTKRPDRRVIVFVGDGSALLTAQEIGSMLRDDMKPIIFLLNNDGYTVERAINGPGQRYNDIAQWDWTLVPKAMGRDKSFLSLRTGTVGELADALAKAQDASALTLLEVILPKLDVPPLLDAICQAIATKNRA